MITVYAGSSIFREGEEVMALLTERDIKLIDLLAILNVRNMAEAVLNKVAFFTGCTC